MDNRYIFTVHLTYLYSGLGPSQPDIINFSKNWHESIIKQGCFDCLLTALVDHNYYTDERPPKKVSTRNDICDRESVYS